MSNSNFYPDYVINDEQVLYVCRSWKNATFVPIPTYSIIARNLRENDFIYSHSVEKFQNIMRI